MVLDFVSFLEWMKILKKIIERFFTGNFQEANYCAHGMICIYSLHLALIRYIVNSMGGFMV